MQIDVKNIAVSSLSLTDIAKIKPLWELLNSVHLANSRHWKEHFTKQTFEQRFEKLLKSAEVYVLIAEDGNEMVGYVVASIKEYYGEIDSIFISDEYRGSGVGHQLVSQAVEWLKLNDVDEIVVAVADGNDAVIPFYDGLGFKKNMTLLKMKG